MQWKQCSFHSNGFKCVAACNGCRGTECQNSVLLEILVGGQSNIEDRFDNNIFLFFQFMISYKSLNFFKYSDEPLIQKVNVNLPKLSVFYWLKHTKNVYSNKNIYTIKTDNVWWEPNSPEHFIEELTVFILIFVAKINRF